MSTDILWMIHISFEIRDTMQNLNFCTFASYWSDDIWPSHIRIIEDRQKW
jgi:hypothetical protein